MGTRPYVVAAVLASVSLAAGAPPAAAEHRSSGPPPTVPADAPRRLPPPRALPRFFEENRGQADPAVRYLFRATFGHLEFRAGAVAVRGPGGGFRMEPAGGDPAVLPEAEDRLPGRLHSYKGRDPSRWVRGAATWGRVRYRDFWPGIDLLWSIRGTDPEYQCIIQPYTDPRAAAFSLPGSSGAETTPEGALRVRAGGVEFLHTAPIAWQEGPAGRRPVACVFEIRPDGTVGFAPGAHDRARELVIDPRILGKALVGGEGSDGDGRIGVAPDGTVVVTGSTSSLDLLPAGQRGHRSSAMDVFVAWIDPSGTTLLDWAVFGGSASETPRGMGVGPDGSVAVAGDSISDDLPTTREAYQPGRRGRGGGFVARLGPERGRLTFLTYLGVEPTNLYDATTEISDVAVDGEGSVLCLGETGAVDFPWTGEPPPVGRRGVRYGSFLAKFSPDGRKLLRAMLLPLRTSLGTSVLALDRGGAAYCAGVIHQGAIPDIGGMRECPPQGPAKAVAKITPGGRVEYLACFAGGHPRDMAVDVDGSVIVVGETRSGGFPLRNPAMGVLDGIGDLYVLRISPHGDRIVHSSYLGLGVGNQDMEATVALDSRGRALVAGWTINNGEWMRTPPDRRPPLTARRFLTRWTRDGHLEWVKEFTLPGNAGGPSWLASGPSGAAYLAGDWSVSEAPPGTPPPYRVKNEVFLVVIDPDGDSVLPAPPGEADPRRRLAPIPEPEDVVWDPPPRPADPEASAPAPIPDPAGVPAGTPDASGTGAPSSGEVADGTREGASGEGEDDDSPVRPTKGLLVDRPLALEDRMRLEGRFALDALEALGAFDPGTTPLRVEVGGRTAPFILDIPAGDPGWTVGEGGKLTWESPRGGEFRAEVILHPRRGAFFLRLQGFDFPAPQENPVRVLFEAGLLRGGHEAHWKAVAEGVYRYPE